MKLVTIGPVTKWHHAAESASLLVSGQKDDLFSTEGHHTAICALLPCSTDVTSACQCHICAAVKRTVSALLCICCHLHAHI